MPLYDYACVKCGALFERIGHTADSCVTCTACGDGIALRQVTGVPTIRINGYSEKNGYSKEAAK